MSKLTLTASLILLIELLIAQPTSYVNSRDEKHLCGPVQVRQLTSDTLYAKWFEESYSAFKLIEENPKWKKKLRDVEVDIYFGSWCGDSKNYVPKFMHLWDDLGLNQDQLNLIALYDTEEKYKQGPSGEEKDLDIHRVPTFIFKRDGSEFARLVEFPRTSLERDLAQIALGYAPAPSYQAASYMQNLLNEMSPEDVYKDANKYWREIYEYIGGMKELNTLGYVYLRSDRIEEALLCFHFNTYYFPYNPNAFDSYAEGLLVSGDTAKAITNYEKVLEIKPDDENAKEQLALLKVVE